MVFIKGYIKSLPKLNIFQKCGYIHWLLCVAMIKFQTVKSLMNERFSRVHSFKKMLGHYDWEVRAVREASLILAGVQGVRSHDRPGSK